MAAPTRNTSTAFDLDPITADMMAAEMHEWAARVKAENEQSGTPRIAASRVRNLERFAGRLERIATAGADE